MNTLRKISAAAGLALCLLFLITISPAQDSNDNKKLDRAKDTVDHVREPDPPEVDKSTDTAKDRADRENEKEKEREKERARKLHEKEKEPPPPRH